jgi:hypothetical protein
MISLLVFAYDTDVFGPGLYRAPAIVVTIHLSCVVIPSFVDEKMQQYLMYRILKLLALEACWRAIGKKQPHEKIQPHKNTRAGLSSEITKPVVTNGEDKHAMLREWSYQLEDRQEGPIRRVNAQPGGTMGSGSDSIIPVLPATMNEKQRSALTSMERSFPDEPDFCAADLARFLRARKYDVTAACKMLRAHKKWRAHTLPISQEVAEPILQQRKFYYVCQSQEGRPCVYIRFRSFMNAKYDAERALAAYIYMIENTVLPNCASDGTWTVLIDVSGVRHPGSIPMSFLSRLNSVFEANYPERLNKTVIFPMPWYVTRFMNAAMSRLLDPVTKEKFAFVTEMSQLAEGAGVPLADLVAKSEEIRELYSSGHLGAAVALE